MTERRGLPHTFGWLLLIRASGDDADLPAVNRTPHHIDLWETPTGEQYWLAPHARLEREGHDYTVCEPLFSRATRLGVR
jgi:hypothetical protein